MARARDNSPKFRKKFSGLFIRWIATFIWNSTTIWEQKTQMASKKTLSCVRHTTAKTSPIHVRSKATLAPDMLDDVTNSTTSAFPCKHFAKYIKDSQMPETRQRDGVKSFKEIPGPRGLPLIGNAMKYSALGPYSFEKILDNRLTYMRKYGPIYRERLGNMWLVNLFDPADIAAMFRQEGRYPSRGTIANLEVTYLERNEKLVGFAFRDGPEWARQRGIIQKIMMHPTAATRYLHWQIPVARDFADYLGQKRDCDGIVRGLYEDLFKYTMESVGSVSFGERLGAFSLSQDQDDESALLSAAIADTFYCFRNCMFAFPWYQYFRTPMYKRFEKASNTMRRIMAKHVQKVSNRVRSKHSTLPRTARGDAERMSVADQHDSMFEVLLSDDRVSEELAINLIMALFRTGIDSTANALAFLLYNLANNPDKQRHLLDELDTVLPGGAPLTPEALAKMPYLKAALKESFRLHFPVFGGSGRVMPEDTVFSGYNVPKGVFIFANMAATSVMPEYFPRPEQYHPERWLRDSRRQYSATWPEEPGFLSLGFSHGLRACPGKRFAEQGLYLAVVSILQKYRLEYHGDSMGMIHMPFTVPDKPLDITFIPRTQAEA